VQVNTRRSYFRMLARFAAGATGARMLFAQQGAGRGTPPGAAAGGSARSNHIHDGIYYFSGIGSNDGYPKDDHVYVTDPFEKHVTRTMDALKKSLERAGCTMDSIIHCEVFICLPSAEGVTAPAGKARFDAYKAEYDTLNKVYRTYFSPGHTPSRACMAVDWIPGDSLIEIVGSALVVSSSTTAPA
jgi:enamine deaminase RidA (YjgF/YER057c/UK114 family)